ncbi:DUF3800 domain-containing protein [Bacillus sp. NP157]|nr:DUF3800 domain-containing protein [Bacillus sp. NP157]
MHIYADESGDLGWNFEPPYGRRGSSRFLTIFATCVPDEKCHHLDRVVRQMYKASRWTTKKERKWTDASEPSRLHFVRQAAQLLRKHPDISYHAIVAYKPNVMRHIRDDPNKLYNYMLKLMLLDEMKKHQTVHFIPDHRSVKVESGSSLHDYLQTELWLALEVPTRLHTKSADSGQCRALQFADFMAGAINAMFEHGRAQYASAEGLVVETKRLYFPRPLGRA